MSVRKLKPITPGQRFRVVNGFDAITTDKPEKSLLAPIKRSGGRNSQGKMTMRYIGGGHKKRYRIIDFNREKAGIPAEVKSIEYDPNRTAFIALLNYQDRKISIKNYQLRRFSKIQLKLFGKPLHEAPVVMINHALTVLLCFLVFNNTTPS